MRCQLVHRARHALALITGSVMLAGLALAGLVVPTASPADAYASNHGQPVVVINPGGGQQPDGSDGIRILLNSNGIIGAPQVGQDQIWFKNTTQYIGHGAAPMLNIGGTLYGEASAAEFWGDASWSDLWVVSVSGSTTTAGGTDTGDGTAVLRYTVDLGDGRIYIVDRTLTYTYPDPYVTEQYDITIPAGNASTVKLYQGGDTSPGGVNSGVGEMVTSPVRAVYSIDGGSQTQIGYSEVAGEIAFDGAYSADYTDSTIAVRTGGDLGLTADGSSHDAGLFVQWTLGATPGNYQRYLRTYADERGASLSASLSASTVSAGDPVDLDLELLNTDSSPQSVDYTFELPAGVEVDGTLTAFTCGGGVSTGTTFITLSGGTVPANDTCLITVPVAADVPGSYDFTSAAVTSISNARNTVASSTLSVTGAALTAAFDPTSVRTGDPADLDLTITNSDPGPVAGLGYTFELPANLEIDGAVSADDCGGTTTAAVGSTTVTVSGAAVAGSGNCLITVPVASDTAADYTVSSASVTSTASVGNGVTNQTLAVTDPPSLTAAFDPTTTQTDDSVDLDLTITNPNTDPETGLGYVVELPNGVVFGSEHSSTCGGTVTATPGQTTITLVGGTAAASSTCEVAVDVVAGTAGDYTVSSASVTGTTIVTNDVTDTTLTVTVPPTLTAALDPAVTRTDVPADLDLTITNTNTTAETGLGFVFELPAGVEIDGLASANTCDGTLTAIVGSSTITLSGATAPGSGSCLITLPIAADESGNYNFSSASVTGTTLVDNGVTDMTLAVSDFPVLSAMLDPATTHVEDPVDLKLTLTNANPAPETGVGYTFKLPNGVVIDSLAITHNCTNGVLSVTTGGSTITLTGATLAASGTCLISVPISATTAGDYAFTGDAVTSTTVTNTVNTTLTVTDHPTLTAQFDPDTTRVDVAVDLDLTITNPNTSTETGLGWTFDLPTGVELSSLALTHDCTNGTLSITSGGTTIGLSGATVPGSGHCTVTVPVVADTAGTYDITSSSVTATVSVENQVTTTTLTVIEVPTLTAAYDEDATRTGDPSDLVLTVTNTNATAETGLGFVFELPAGLEIDDEGTPANTCDGTLTATGGTTTVTSSNAQVAGEASCTVTVPVLAATAGDYTISSASVTGTTIVANEVTDDTLVVTDLPVLTATYTSLVARTEVPVGLDLTITNPNASPETGLGYSFKLPAGLVLDTALPAAACDGTLSGEAGESTITLTGATAPASDTCLVEASVVAESAGDYELSDALVSETTIVDNQIASSTLVVTVMPALTAGFDPTTVRTGLSAELDLTITNVNSGAETGLGFVFELPTGLEIAGVPTADTCDGTTTGTTTITVSGASVPGEQNCVVTVPVSADTAGDFTISDSSVTGTTVVKNSVTEAMLTVADFPTLQAEYATDHAHTGNMVALRLEITNPNTTTETGLGYVFELPAGLVIGTPSPLLNICDGTLTATTGTTTITLTGAQVAGSVSCAVLVPVTTATPGDYPISSASVTSTTIVANSVTDDTLTVTEAADLTAAFGAATARTDEAVDLTLTVTNANTTAETGLGFTFELPAGLTVDEGTPTDSCTDGSLSISPEGDTITNTGFTVDGSASCAVTVPVAADTAGDYEIGAASVTSSTNLDNTVTGDTLTVNAYPAVTATFGDTETWTGDPVDLHLTITNPNTFQEGGLGYVFELPTDLEIGSGTPTNGCLDSTVVAGVGGTTVTMSGAIVSASDNCVLTLPVVADTAGSYSISSASVTSTTMVDNDVADATLTVSDQPTLTASFDPASTLTNVPVDLKLQLTNTNAGAQSGLGYTFQLPSSLVIGLTTPTNGCGGTLTASAGSHTITLTDVTVAAAGNCVLSIPVVAATSGSYLITSGSVTSTTKVENTVGTSALVVTALPILTVMVDPATTPAGNPVNLQLTLTSDFGPLQVAGAQAVSLLANIGAPDPITDVGYVVQLPTGLRIGTGAPTNTCGGTLTADANGTTVTLTGGELYPSVGITTLTAAAIASVAPASATCTVTVPILSNKAGNYAVTSASVTSTTSVANGVTHAPLEVTDSGVCPAFHGWTVVSDQVTRLYQSILGRSPDMPGLLHWSQARMAGVPIQSLAQLLLSSPERFNRVGALSNEAFVEQLYLDTLGRTVEPDGKAYWVDLLNNGLSRTVVILAISDSAEAVNRTGTTAAVTNNGALVCRLYRSLFDRSPDSGGFAHWLSLLDAGLSPEFVAAAILALPEATSLRQMPMAEFIDHLYRHSALNRPADNGGSAHWGLLGQQFGRAWVTVRLANQLETIR